MENLHDAGGMSTYRNFISNACGWVLVMLPLVFLQACSKSTSGVANDSPSEDPVSPGLQYKGHSFYYWYARWADSTERSGDQARIEGDEAMHAMRQIGTNALPLLLERLEARDLHSIQPYVAPNGVFAILGPIAAPAIPELEAILQDTNRASMQAAYCLAAIGDPAVPAFVRLLRSQHEDTRYQVTYQLGAKLEFADEFTPRGTNLLALIPPLIERVEDKDPYTAIAAIRTLAVINMEQASIQTALNRAVLSTNKEVREVASKALASISSK